MPATVLDGKSKHTPRSVVSLTFGCKAIWHPTDQQNPYPTGLAEVEDTAHYRKSMSGKTSNAV